MSSVDLEAELDAAVSRVRNVHLDRLRALGVSPSIIADVGTRQPPFGVVMAEADGDGLYVPSDGPAFIVQPIYEAGGLIDLVAWRSLQPDRWWLRTGLGWLLNGDECLYGGWDGHLLSLFSTPLDWLRSGATGSVVLDWEAPDLAQLRGFQAIECDSPGLAKTLAAALRRQRIPQIRVRETARAA